MYFFAWQSQGNYGNLAFFNAVMTTHTFTNRKSFLVHPYISVHRFKKSVQLLPGKIRKFPNSTQMIFASVFCVPEAKANTEADQMAKKAMNGFRPRPKEKVGQSHCDQWNNPQVFTEE